MRKSAAILLFIFFSLAAIWSQEVKVTAAFDTTRIYLGDQTNFTVTIIKPVSYLLNIPLFRDSLQKNLEIIKGPDVDTTLLKDGRIKLVQKYLITSFDSGKYEVPPVYAEFKGENGIKRFYSDYSTLEVMRVKIAPSDTTSKIFDIVKPYRAPVTAGEIMPWILLALVISACIWYGVKYIRKMRKKETGDLPVIQTDPAHVIAFRQLEQLKKEKLWEKGDLKGYYTRLTEIARTYLENRFNIYSMELTTPETLTELRNAGFREDESYRKIRTVLTGADLVKFAKFVPDPSENELQYNYIWDFVGETRMETELKEDNEKVETNSAVI